jgi:hypothetical protein
VKYVITLNPPPATDVSKYIEKNSNRVVLALKQCEQTTGQLSFVQPAHNSEQYNDFQPFSHPYDLMRAHQCIITQSEPNNQNCEQKIMAT